MRSKAVCTNVLMQALCTSRATFGTLESVADRLSVVRVVQRITVFTTDSAIPVVVPLTPLLLGLLLTFLLIWRPCAFLWLCCFLGERSLHCHWPRDFFLLCSLPAERQRCDEVARASAMVLPARFIRRVASFLSSKLIAQHHRPSRPDRLIALRVDRFEFGHVFAEEPIHMVPEGLWIVFGCPRLVGIPRRDHAPMHRHQPILVPQLFGRGGHGRLCTCSPQPHHSFVALLDKVCLRCVVHLLCFFLL